MCYLNLVNLALRDTVRGDCKDIADEILVVKTVHQETRISRSYPSVTFGLELFLVEQFLLS